MDLESRIVCYDWIMIGLPEASTLFLIDSLLQTQMQTAKKFQTQYRCGFKAPPNWTSFWRRLIHSRAQWALMHFDDINTFVAFKWPLSTNLAAGKSPSKFCNLWSILLLLLLGSRQARSIESKNSVDIYFSLYFVWPFCCTASGYFLGPAALSSPLRYTLPGVTRTHTYSMVCINATDGK